jgi:hypothetical protein
MQKGLNFKFGHKNHPNVFEIQNAHLVVWYLPIDLLLAQLLQVALIDHRTKTVIRKTCWYRIIG